MCAGSLATTDEQWAAAMTIAAFFSGIAMPCTWAAVVDIGGESSGVVMGYVNIGSCLAGIAITPAVGHLIDHLRAAHGNWNLVIFVHAAFYLASALCWFLVDPGQSIISPESGHAV
jgi:MFS family permease